MIGAGPSIPDASSFLVGSQWRRLHPLSPVVRLGGVLVAMLFLLIPSLGTGATSAPQSGSRPNIGLLLLIGLAILSVVGGFVSWLVTRWRIHDGDLQIEKGVLRRQSLRIPLTRIQAIDVVAPLTARILGLAEVRVVSAGRGAERGRLAYLSASEAPVVRAQLLALAHGLAPETPEPAVYPLLRVDNGRLAVALALRAPVFGPVLFLVGAIVAASLAGPGDSSSVLNGILSAGFFVVVATFRAFNEDFRFSISEAGDGLHLDRGFIQKRHETIPFGRIQAVRLVEPLLWRPFGWCRLEVDVARQHMRERADRDANQVARTLVPVASREHAAWLMGRVMPGARLLPPPGSAPPRRARLRAPLSYHFLAVWYGDQYVCARTGRVRAATVVVPLEKIQSVRMSSGPLQRLLRLATVHIDTAGRRWQASAHCRDAAEAEAMLWRIAELARHARRRRVDALQGAAAVL